MKNDITNRRKSNFGQFVCHFCNTQQSELLTRKRFAALRPIASRIRHRIIEIADLLRLAVKPVPSAYQPEATKVVATPPYPSTNFDPAVGWTAG